MPALRFFQFLELNLELRLEIKINTNRRFANRFGIDIYQCLNPFLSGFSRGFVYAPALGPQNDSSPTQHLRVWSQFGLIKGGFNPYPNPFLLDPYV